MDSVNNMNKVMEKRNRGYNCAQSVACAYCTEFGVDEKEAFKATEGFGGGMGVMGPCGAVSAMIYLAGLKNSDGDIDNPKTKASTAKLSKELYDKFVEMNGSAICKDLKGIETGVVLRSCQGCIEDAGKIVEEFLLEKND